MPLRVVKEGDAVEELVQGKFVALEMNEVIVTQDSARHKARHQFGYVRLMASRNFPQVLVTEGHRCLCSSRIETGR